MSNVVVRAALVSLAVVAADSQRAQGQPSPAPSATVGGARMPSLNDAPTVEVRGKIVQSTRGQEGPVRMEVEAADGVKQTVLVAPNALCEELGLSLRPGENVQLVGALVQGRNPIVVAREFDVDGKKIRVRDDRGRVIDSSRPTPEGSPAPRRKQAR